MLAVSGTWPGLARTRAQRSLQIASHDQPGPYIIKLINVGMLEA